MKTDVLHFYKILRDGMSFHEIVGGGGSVIRKILREVHLKKSTTKYRLSRTQTSQTLIPY